MIARLGTAPRIPGMGLEDFQAHWRTSHADVVGGLPGLRSYVQLHAVLDGGRTVLPHPGFDACSLLVFDDVEAMDAAFDSPRFRSDVQADEAEFVDKTRFRGVVGAWESDDVPAPDQLGPYVLLTLWRAVRGGRERLLRGARAGVAEARGALLAADAELHRGRFPVGADVVELTSHADVDAARAHLRGGGARRVGGSLAGCHLATPVVVTATTGDRTA